MSDIDDPLAPGDVETADLGTVLGDLAGELSELAERCRLLQETISALLDKVDHPDLGAEIHMLQDIDRIQQTLSDLAAILAVAHPAGCGRPVHRDAIGDAVRLESLRQRLGLSNDPDGHRPPFDDTDVTWL